MFPKIGVPPNHPFNMVFHYFHHPFWGFSPYFWHHPNQFELLIFHLFFSSTSRWFPQKHPKNSGKIWCPSQRRNGHAGALWRFPVEDSSRSGGQLPEVRRSVAAGKKHQFLLAKFAKQKYSQRKIPCKRNTPRLKKQFLAWWFYPIVE